MPKLKDSTKENINGIKRSILRFLGSKNFKVYIVSVIILTLIVSGIILVVNISKSNDIKKALAEKEKLENFSSGSIQAITVNTIAIPDNYKGKRDNSPIFFRSELKNWTDKQIKDFLYNSKQLATQIIEKENDEDIEKIFENIN